MEDRAAGDVIDLKFNTTVAGVPFTLAGTPAISVYKDNGTTESTSGVTLTVDFDGRTGLHNVNITTASDGTFYANGHDFQVVITTGTVNGNSAVGLMVGVFSLANRTVNWGSVANKTTANALTATSIITTQKVDVDTIKTNPVVNGGTITFPTTATLASTTNITAGTITTATTATNLTNAPTAGDFTATMKTSIGTAVAASAVASVTGAVGSVTGNVGGNVVGSVASVTAAVATTSNIKKNQALAKFQFLMTDSTNHAPATGKTVTCTRSIDGAAFGAGTLANIVEVANGTYSVDFGAGDLNGNVIVLRATAASCDDTFERIVSQP